MEEKKHLHNCNCHHHEHQESDKNKLSKYKNFEFDDNTDDSCDLDPSKTCDNCGRCIDLYNTDKGGFVQIQIDKIDKSGTSLNDLYKMYGLDKED